MLVHVEQLVKVLSYATSDELYHPFFFFFVYFSVIRESQRGRKCALPKSSIIPIDLASGNDFKIQGQHSFT